MVKTPLSFTWRVPSCHMWPVSCSSSEQPPSGVPQRLSEARRTRAVLRVMTLIRKFVSFKGESSDARKTDFCPPRTEIPH